VQVALTYTAPIVVALAAQQAGRPDLIRPPKCVLAHVWEGFESGIEKETWHWLTKPRVEEVLSLILNYNSILTRSSPLCSPSVFPFSP